MPKKQVKTKKAKTRKTKKTKEGKKEKKRPKHVVVSGRRKKSIARVTAKPGTGKVLINKKPIELFNSFQQLILNQPLILAQQVLKEKLNEIDLIVVVRGGGVESQVDASRLAIAKALLAYTKDQELKKAFLHYDRMLLIADTRQKEMRKPGISKARKKRQKSYR